MVRWNESGAAQVAAGGILAVLLIAGVVLVALPKFQEGNEVPEFALVSLAVGTCPDFPNTDLDGDCADATEVSFVGSAADEQSILVEVTSDASAGTLVPDSFSIDLQLRRTDSFAWGEVMNAGLRGRALGLEEWTVPRAGGAGDRVVLYETAQSPTTGDPLYGWTGEAGLVQWGAADGGAIAAVASSETVTVSFSLYLNEDELPTTIPTDQVFTRALVLEFDSVVPGHPGLVGNTLSVTLTLQLTSNA